MPRVPKGKGRKKTATQKIENPSSLDVSFCKRRYGIFKKAIELCILCGCQVAIIMSSVKKKLYSFGHTSAELVSNRFMRGEPQKHSLDQMLSEIYVDEEFELNEADINEVEKIKASGKSLNHEDANNNNKYWWLVQQKGPKMTLEDYEKMEADACAFKSYLCSVPAQEECGPSNGMESGFDYSW